MADEIITDKPMPLIPSNDTRPFAPDPMPLIPSNAPLSNEAPATASGNDLSAQTNKTDINQKDPVTGTPAHERLRAFEDEFIGKDAPRINGHIERGHGSLFDRELSPNQKAHYAKLEHLVHTEKRMADASAALEKAKVENDAAMAAADTAEKAAAEPIDGDTK